jgi:putative transposase
MFRRHAGAVRFIYNWGLATLTKDYEARKVSLQPGEKVKGALKPLDLQARLPILKVTEFPWLRDVTAQCLQRALRNLDSAFKGFFRRVKAGKTPGYPKFKKRGIRDSFQFAQNVKITPTHVRLPKIGAVRLKQHGYIPTDLPCRTVTVSERAGRWFVTVLIEVPEPQRVVPTGEVLGIDLGIKTLATLSDGTVYQNPKHLEHTQRKLTHLQRQLARQQKGSHRRAKTKAKIATVHARISNQRSDVLHKMTTGIVKTKRPPVVVIEDLNVSGMTKNHCLARYVSSASFAEIRRQFTYKCGWYGVQLVLADRFYPSSKTCSQCGWVKPDLTLGNRVFRCEKCGLILDRDLNASLNLRGWGVRFLAGGTPATARGGIVNPEVTQVDSAETRTDLRIAS